MSGWSDMKLSPFVVAVFVYYCVVICLALFLPFENQATVYKRVFAVITSAVIVVYRDRVVCAVFGAWGADLDWLVFVPLTLFFVIMFGGSWAAEQKEMLFGALIHQ